jgi:hypothetical protein
MRRIDVVSSHAVDDMVEPFQNGMRILHTLPRVRLGTGNERQLIAWQARLR